MTVVLNVKVGQKITFRDPASGMELDAEIVEFPKILRVKTADGALRDITPEQVLTEEPKKGVGSRFGNRLNQSRL
jgi:hypothetical protein